MILRTVAQGSGTQLQLIKEEKAFYTYLLHVVLTAFYIESVMTSVKYSC